MIRLSYKPGVSWQPNHVRDYLQELRKMSGSGLVAYAWVAELQKRGVVHYHIFMVVLRGTNVPTPDKSGMWPHGSTKIETGKSPYYLVTYLGKEYQKDFGQMSITYPGMRSFAVWANKDFFKVSDYWVFRLSSLPMWLDKLISSVDDFVGLYPYRLRGVGWVLKVPLHVRRGKLYKKYNYITSDWVVDSF